jgi:hypothetical protein
VATAKIVHVIEDSGMEADEQLHLRCIENSINTFFAGWKK